MVYLYKKSAQEGIIHQTVHNINKLYCTTSSYSDNEVLCPKLYAERTMQTKSMQADSMNMLYLGTLYEDRL